MSLLGSPVGRRAREVRVATRLTYLILTLGGITMVYPFLIMISGSFKSDVDLRDWDVIPRYFYSDRVLYRKYVEATFNESVALYNSTTAQAEFSFRRLQPPPPAPPARAADWHAFAASGALPPSWSVLGAAVSVNNRLYPKHARGWRAWVVRRCGGSIGEYRRRYGSLVASWLNVSYPTPVNPADRAFKRTGSPLAAEAAAYAASVPLEDLVVASLDGRYVTDFLKLKYGADVAALNAAWRTRFADWAAVRLPARAPRGGAARADWLAFVRGDLNLQFIGVDASARGAYAAFLERRYDGSLAALNRAWRTRFGSFAAVPYPADRLTVGTPLVDWELFLQEAPAGSLSIDGPEFRWRAWLHDRYRGDLAALNAAHGTAWRSFAEPAIPAREALWAEVEAHRTALRWEFATRNYRHVFEYLALHGRALWNTLVFCALSILAVLIVNPLAAYAMSRFQLPATYRVLLFLLATIAFPPMVTTIPNFLLLKQLGMLNTFWALLLPGMVNGYAIFLLKGFFDSLPRELYEAAQLDGAGEWTMFWGLTMHLSKPVLAVIALDAFNAAYGAFMYAFIVCQDERMWTLSVWLYQLQQNAHQSVTFAALLVASVPTLLVFVFAQRIILEGIVVPTEK